MDMFNEPRCAECANKTQATMIDNRITLTGNINCCFVRGLLWYLKPCCFISYICGGKQGPQLEEDIRNEMFNRMAKKEAYVFMDGNKYIVYQVDNRIRNLKISDHQSITVINDIKLSSPPCRYNFISKKDFELDQ